MARWTDLAEWRGPTVNQGGAMRAHLGVVVHIADGTYEGTISWQRNPGAEVSSNFIVARDGRIAQMVDTDVTAWTQRAGNGSWLSVENEGRTGQSLTAQQIEANARILARAHREYGVPLQVTGTPAKRGLGHHSMGAENGIDWGHSECPGPAIKAQKPQIVARAIEIINGKTAQVEDDMGLTEQQIKDWGGALAGLYAWHWQADALLKTIAAKVDLSPEEVAQIAAAAPRPDTQGIVSGVLAGLSPEAIAAAIPTELASQVADELAARLQS